MWHRVKHYPPSRLRELRSCWTSLALLTLFFGAPSAAAMYSAVTGTFDLLMATLLLAIFLFVFGFTLPLCIESARHVRLVPILANDGRNTWVRNPKALEFLMDDRKGQAIGENYQLLVSFGRQQNIAAISDFGAVNVRDNDIAYFDAEEGLRAISALVAFLKLNADLVQNPEIVIQDLSDAEAVLGEAVSERRRFCFAVM